MFISEYIKIIYRDEIVAELPVDRSHLWQLHADILAVREEQQRQSGFFIIARECKAYGPRVIDFESGTNLYEVLESLQKTDRDGHSIFFEDKGLVDEYYKNVLKRDDATKKQVGHILSYLGEKNSRKKLFSLEYLYGKVSMALPYHHRQRWEYLKPV